MTDNKFSLANKIEHHHFDEHDSKWLGFVVSTLFSTEEMEMTFTYLGSDQRFTIAFVTPQFIHDKGDKVQHLNRQLERHERLETIVLDFFDNVKGRLEHELLKG